MIRKNDIYLLFLFSTVVIIVSFVLYPRFLSDDAFIHIGFIKGMLNGEGFSFTRNKTYGTTSPLWVILGTLLTTITSSPKFSIRLLSAVFTLLSIYLIYFALLKLNIKTSIIISSIISFILNPFLLRWSLTGMEVTACISFVLLIYLLINKKNSKTLLFWTGIISGLSILLRPEFLAFYIVLIFFTFFSNEIKRKNIIFLIAPGFIIISSWLLFSYLYFGTIVPNTYIAKANNSFFNISSETVTRNIKLFLAGNLSEFFILFILLLFVLITFRKNLAQLYSQVKTYLYSIVKSKLFLLVLWILSFYIFYILKDVTIISRYSLMLNPAIIILTAYTLNYSINNFSKKKKILIISFYIFFSIFGYGFMTFSTVKPASDNFVKGFQKTYMNIAFIIKNDSDKINKTVALNDVGIIGSYSGAKVYDFAGLVDRTRFQYNSTKDYVLSKKPDYIILREDQKINNILPGRVKYKVLFKKFIPGFGINEPDWRYVILYKIFWQ